MDVYLRDVSNTFKAFNTFGKGLSGIITTYGSLKQCDVL